MKRFFLPLIILAFSVSAFASSNRFTYDVNGLSSSAAIESLHVQIERFARSYCRARTGTLDGIQACYKGVEEEIVEKINNARLTAYSQTGDHAADVASR
ncbi:MAG: UrcA family protein [Gammaproteobacteria bacterium]|nr:UrcA family protein [Gammaproteobacteria bacterium]